MPTLHSMLRNPDKLKGVWVHMGNNLYFCIAHHSGGYERELEELRREHARSLRVRASANEELMPEIIKLVVKHLLVNWGKGEGAPDDAEELLDDKGAPIRFSKAEALKVLSNPMARAFVDDTIQAAMTDALYRNDEVEEALGNSEGSSSGTATTAETGS